MIDMLSLPTSPQTRCSTSSQPRGGIAVGLSAPRPGALAASWLCAGAGSSWPRAAAGFRSSRDATVLGRRRPVLATSSVTAVFNRSWDVVGTARAVLGCRSGLWGALCMVNLCYGPTNSNLLNRQIQLWLHRHQEAHFVFIYTSLARFRT